MSDAFVSVLLTQLASITEQKIRQEVRLVVGVKKEIEKLSTTLRSIQALLVDADKKQVKDETVKLWLENLKDVTYDTDDVLTEWSTAILKLKIEGFESSSNPKKKVCFFTSFPCFSFDRVVFRRDIALKIKAINGRLDAIATDKARYTLDTTSLVVEKQEHVKFSSVIDVSKVRGRDGDKNTLVSKLLCETFSRTDGGPLHIISIVGMGGIGKTTLAQWAYNCDEVKEHFELRIWVCISDSFDEVRVAKAIVEDAEGSAPNVAELEPALRYVKNCVLGKKFLLVLDDVCTDDDRKWEPLLITLKSGAFGSKVLVTSRTERVSKMMDVTYTLRLKQLSGQECWDLFSQIAFSSERSEDERGELEDIGRRIADKCNGLPLAAKTIGSLMRFKTAVQDWQGVLDSEIWELEGAEKRLFPPLLLSYYDLPSPIKRCFSYCANFPKDYKIDADNLIKIWMAQGYLTTSGSVEMEIIGQEYLETLVMRSFFQDLEKDKGGNIERFKMHDMVHDFALYLTKNECLITEADSGMGRSTGSAPKRYRHLTIIRGEDSPFPLPVANTERLHTFWVQSFYESSPIVSEIDRAPPELFRHLKFVKVLDLSRNRLRELPKEVGNLIHLRYLNLSHNPLEKLPEEVCDLYNLQTLKLSACDHLKKLPQEMENLLNLRHLEIDRTESLRTLPKGISKLSYLRTLSKFVIGSAADTEEAVCKLGDLGNLKHLRGSLKMEGLGYVTDEVEAEKAELKNKEQLVDLHIDFTPSIPSVSTTSVIEALQLNTSLQCLQIKSYGGARFPNWMNSLNSLRNLQLQDCHNCICLPALGTLQSLETLVVENMDSLKRIGPEFLGVKKASCSSGGSSSSSIIAFPKLRKLKIDDLSDWEEWYVSCMEGGVEGREFIKIMPCLGYLKVSNCNKLKKLPDLVLQLASLKKLRINNSTLLQQRYQKGIGEDWEKISHIPKTRISQKLN